MADYRFAGRWHLDAPVADVAAVVVDLEHYPHWWPQGCVAGLRERLAA